MRVVCPVPVRSFHCRLRRKSRALSYLSATPSATLLDLADYRPTSMTRRTPDAHLRERPLLRILRPRAGEALRVPPATARKGGVAAVVRARRPVESRRGGCGEED